MRNTNCEENTAIFKTLKRIFSSYFFKCIFLSLCYFLSVSTFLFIYLFIYMSFSFFSIYVYFYHIVLNSLSMSLSLSLLCLCLSVCLYVTQSPHFSCTIICFLLLLWVFVSQLDIFHDNFDNSYFFPYFSLSVFFKSTLSLSFALCVSLSLFLPLSL